MTLKSTFRRFWPVQTAHAHCDIPCGIYDPIAAKIAAQTVQKMVLRIEAAEPPGPNASAEDRRRIQLRPSEGPRQRGQLATGPLVWGDPVSPGFGREQAIPIVEGQQQILAPGEVLYEKVDPL